VEVDVHYLVRWAHVAAAAVLVGGSAFAGVAMRRRMEPQAALALCRDAEWVLWGALGVLVATGVGNLGAFGEGLPGPESAWGTTLLAKLALVVLLLLLSGARAAAVSRAARGAALRRLSAAYLASAALGATVIAFATALAHA
jgi:putative copper export protein